MAKNPKRRCGNCRFTTAKRLVGKGSFVTCSKYGVEYSSNATECMLHEYCDRTQTRIRLANEREEQRKAEETKAMIAETEREPAPPTRQHPIWTEEKLSKLKEMFFSGARMVEIEGEIMIPRVDIIRKIATLKLKRDIVDYSQYFEPKEVVQKVQKPADEEVRHQYAGFQPCNGQCCKIKEFCKHYLHYVEAGKPTDRLIRAQVHCLGKQRFHKFVGIDGSTTPERVTFSETC